MDTSEHCKEVYAYFGLAMYRAQCVEQSIVQLLIFFDFFTENASKFRTSNEWEKDFDSFDKALSKKTMGNLLGLIKELGILDDDIESILSLSLKKRNWLAHTYFADRALDFINEVGRNKMIKELEEVIEIFNSVEEALQPMSKSAALKYGLTDEVLDKIKREMIESVENDRNDTY
ncbi:TPA: hypothetical protein PXM78_003028 [Yersinia enterocolitica]|nr:hypothetical protein [Yersinia enterocolitica]HDL6905134.1 hypothetical protein [Yersinia enterocolitica]HDL6909738.1 hypothetical protein [Yersinia enterocolitica]HDL7028115.1 hypothetical protein [Yersinia enterocolitica]HDL7036667.1 hypothetical protein [Yersinia enterocolitica]